MTFGRPVFYNYTIIKNDMIAKEIQFGLAIFLIIMLAVGVIGNCMTIIVISTNKKLQTIPNVYILNLAVADTLLLLSNVPTTVMQFLSFGSSDGLDFSYCPYTSPINITTMLAALHSAGAVSMNRYIFLCKPPELYEKYTTAGWIFASLVFIWVWPLCISLPPLFGFGTYGYHSKFHTCFFIAYDSKSYYFGTIFCCVIGVFPVVMATLFFFYKIFHKISKMAAALMAARDYLEQQTYTELSKEMASMQNRRSSIISEREHTDHQSMHSSHSSNSTNGEENGAKQKTKFFKTNSRVTFGDNRVEPHSKSSIESKAAKVSVTNIGPHKIAVIIASTLDEEDECSVNSNLYDGSTVSQEGKITQEHSLIRTSTEKSQERLYPNSSIQHCMPSGSPHVIELKVVKGKRKVRRKADSKSIKIETQPEPNMNSSNSSIAKTKLDTYLLKKLRADLKIGQLEKQKRAIRMLLLIFIIIVFCWCPIAINFIVDKKNELPSLTYVLFMILAWSNSSVNIFVYAGMNKQFRMAYESLLHLQPTQASSTNVTMTSIGYNTILNSNNEASEDPNLSQQMKSF